MNSKFNNADSTFVVLTAQYTIHMCVWNVSLLALRWNETQTCKNGLIMLLKYNAPCSSACWGAALTKLWAVDRSPHRPHCAYVLHDSTNGLSTGNRRANSLAPRRSDSTQTLPKP